MSRKTVVVIVVSRNVSHLTFVWRVGGHFLWSELLRGDTDAGTWAGMLYFVVKKVDSVTVRPLVLTFLVMVESTGVLTCMYLMTRLERICFLGKPDAAHGLSRSLLRLVFLFEFSNADQGTKRRGSQTLQRLGLPQCRR